MSTTKKERKTKTDAVMPKQGKSRRKRLLIIGAAVFAALIFLVLLLPTLLSTGLGRGIVVGQVNKRLAGKLAIRDWSLGYFSDTRVAGLQLADPDGNAIIEIAEITIPRGLLAFAGSKYDLGEMVVQAPKVNLRLHKDGSTNLSNIVAAGPKKEEPPETTESRSTGAAKPLGIDVFGELVVKNGEITLTPDSGEAFTVRDLNVKIKLDGLDNPIVVSQSAKLGKNGTPMKLDVSATVFKDGLPAGEDLEADVTLGLDEFDMASLAGLMQMFNAPLQTTGVVTMSLTASVKGLNSASAKGAVAVRGLALSGAALKGDHVRMDHARLDFNFARDGEKITISTFALDSPQAKVETQGVLNLPQNAPLPTGSLKSKMRVDLARVAAQLPNTLNLQKGLSIDSGILALDADLASAGNRTEFTMNLNLKDLAATRDGKQIRLDKPVVLAAIGTIEDNQPNLKELKFDSSFCKLEGQGTPKSMNVIMAVDLAAATREAAKFVDLQGKRATGQMGMALKITGDKPTARNIDLVLDLERVVLAGILKQDVSVPKTNVKLNAVVRLNEKFAPQAMENLKLKVTAQRLAELELTADSIVPGKKFPTVKQAKLSLDARLDNTIAFARNFMQLQGIRATGNVEMRAMFNLMGSVVNAEQVSIRLADLDFALNDKHMRERELTLTGAATADLDTRRMAAKNFVLTCSPGKVTVASFLVPDWNHAPEGITADIHGNMELNQTMVMAGDFVKLPPKLKLSGDAVEFTLKALLKDRKQKLDATVALNNVKLQVEDKPPLAEKRMTVAVAGWVDPQAEKVDIKSLALRSDMLSMTAVTELTQFRTRKNLTARGTHVIDFGKLSPLVAAYTQDNVTLTGKRENKFAFSAPLAETETAELLRKMLADTELYLADAKIWGIETDAITIPMSVKDGAAIVKINTIANEGRVRLPLNLTLAEKGNVLTIPNNTVVLDNARLNDDLADRVLSRVAPIFRKCVVNRGRVSYTSQHLKVPLARDRVLDMDVEGRLTLKGVGLGSAPMITDLLKAFGIRQPALTLPDQDVKITIKDGNIHQSAMEIGFGKYKMFLSGVFGVDGKNLDMKANVPITREIVRKFGGSDEVFELLKDEMLLVPLKGDVSLVRFPKDIIAANVKRLLTSTIRDRLIDKGVNKALDKLLKRRRRKKKDTDKEPPRDNRDKQLKKDVDTILKGINDLF